MPRRTRKQLVGRREDQERREQEQRDQALLLTLRREWRWLTRSVGRREAA